MKLFAPLSLTLLTFVGACTMAPQQPSPSSENPIQIWHTGVGYAAHGRYKQAASYLRSSAESGFYPAQMDLAVLLETSPKPVLDPEAAYAWCALVIYRNGTDTDFAKDVQARAKAKMTQMELEVAKAKSKQLIQKLGAKHYP